MAIELRTPAAPLPVLLDVHGLAAQVAGRDLWRGVDLALHAGESVAVVGPSGTGKTVFLRTLAGLRTAAAGRICYAGVESVAWDMPRYRAQVMYVAQRAVLPEGSVRAALDEPFAWRAHGGQRLDVAAAQELLAGLTMPPDFLEQATADLSGGQAQVVALVRALALAPRILLLDEPTAALDRERTLRAEALLRDWLRGGPPRACVWVSHDAEQVARVGDRVLELGAP